MHCFPAYTVEKIETELTDDQITLLLESRADRKEGNGGNYTEDLAMKALNNKGNGEKTVNRIDIEDMENMHGFAVEKVIKHG